MAKSILNKKSLILLAKIVGVIVVFALVFRFCNRKTEGGRDAENQRLRAEIARVTKDAEYWYNSAQNLQSSIDNHQARIEVYQGERVRIVKQKVIVHEKYDAMADAVYSLDDQAAIDSFSDWADNPPD
ncbi:hypothetical protein UFOVP1492_66 [uncultured Caudovirales phage]|uniref:Uncharacterized protein n=1 Tax=uncultured Caudovirales phage TaxID=2100421 RepID=A0A6J5RHD5_9CAUD|nr:hypothetical protein UFOVP1127_68 [uncultured Caudovirales phage]CAB4193001.1 hypothetical protein UFOVP1242_6 [uncultured Caudovirales phage]CAB4217697.1 hypothetical protein UFOVP1492_66 [uncultured Caudovirales phage]CAB5231508.1 hypothetical protein UFOVP1580_95 [uncultured Caudovirales phage]